MIFVKRSRVAALSGLGKNGQKKEREEGASSDPLFAKAGLCLRWRRHYFLGGFRAFSHGCSPNSPLSGRIYRFQYFFGVSMGLCHSSLPQLRPARGDSFLFPVDLIREFASSPALGYRFRRGGVLCLRGGSRPPQFERTRPQPLLGSRPLPHVHLR